MGEKIRSSVITEECEIEPINFWIKDRKLNWNDHMDIMENSRLVKKVQDWIPQQKRPLGRPRLRWKDVTVSRNCSEWTCNKLPAFMHRGRRSSIVKQ